MRLKLQLRKKNLNKYYILIKKPPHMENEIVIIYNLNKDT